MNATLRFLYQHVPSFKQESGGLYNAYVAVHSRTYAARMRYLHQRGRHGRSYPVLYPTCTWCGEPLAR
ncbi:hypothetical protein AB0M57_04710 [Streptomyces sp. NPDC051597]|uniref:hypothetical protein n=1 Tax=Streptomyces sp. NPDC051597 TaxID=3155049 RepID=UPI0034443C1E